MKLIGNHYSESAQRNRSYASPDNYRVNAITF